jgi:hypothetical protein
MKSMINRFNYNIFDFYIKILLQNSETHTNIFLY